MKTLIDAVRALIQPEYESPKVTKSPFVLEETDTNATCREVKVKVQHPANVYAAKFDRAINLPNSEGGLKHPLLMLRPDSPNRSLCDYILFYEKHGVQNEIRFVVFIVNLKSNNIANNTRQMEGGKLLAEFLAQHAVRLYKARNSGTAGFGPLNVTINYHLILFSSSKAEKGLTGPSKGKQNSPNSIFGQKYFHRNCKDTFDLDSL